MPILKENKKRYPENWKALRADILKNRAFNKCEFCGAENYKPHPITKSKVILTIAHLDNTPENCNLDNLKALCQLCHNTYDSKHRAQTRKNKKLINQLKLNF